MEGDVCVCMAMYSCGGLCIAVYVKLWRAMYSYGWLRMATVEGYV